MFSFCRFFLKISRIFQHGHMWSDPPGSGMLNFGFLINPAFGMSQITALPRDIFLTIFLTILKILVTIYNI